MTVQSGDLRAELEPHAHPTDAAALEVCARRLDEPESRAALCGAIAWSAFAAPAAATPVYDAIANSLLGSSLPATSKEPDSVPLPDSFWDAFAAVLTGPEEGYDAGTITVAVASLGAAIHDDFGKLAEAAALSHPGAERAAEKPVPALLSLQKLSRCPEPSLGNDLYRMLVDNNFDPEGSNGN